MVMYLVTVTVSTWTDASSQSKLTGTSHAQADCW